LRGNRSSGDGEEISPRYPETLKKGKGNGTRKKDVAQKKRDFGSRRISCFRGAPEKREGPGGRIRELRGCLIARVMIGLCGEGYLIKGKKAGMLKKRGPRTTNKVFLRVCLRVIPYRSKMKKKKTWGGGGTGHEEGGRPCFGGWG